ncbi:MAG: hypothetical protein H0U75_03275 [Legionella sp.]|nr:hypothetical protein [Legionella sp.]
MKLESNNKKYKYWQDHMEKWSRRGLSPVSILQREYISIQFSEVINDTGY